MTVSLKSLKQYLMGRIDEQDISQVEKVERYIELKKMMNRLIKQVDQDGDTMVTQNGSQSFTKAHPPGYLNTTFSIYRISLIRSRFNLIAPERQDSM